MQAGATLGEGVDLRNNVYGCAPLSDSGRLAAHTSNLHLASAAPKRRNRMNLAISALSNAGAQMVADNRASAEKLHRVMNIAEYIQLIILPYGVWTLHLQGR